ncbi:Erythroid differentiation-related factor 1 [Hondaea fermentalgiana]|uniref:Erythroid differentiation-related factor 1 n=1 Tax=Hondaea fermentalgiana TaxID=2315210 RepID=A0A2R5GDC7_9STRA|nr:Erythroid differentiation-related factor 1 [Hondaea fermentalgiana]|eukprot:GBG28565.1 Erythroid differentiation-related factor 1 [Hondaea fermentalgiana]
MLSGTADLEPLATRRFGPATGGEEDKEAGHVRNKGKNQTRQAGKSLAANESDLGENEIEDNQTDDDEVESLLSVLRGPILQDLTRLHPDQNLNELVLFTGHLTQKSMPPVSFPTPSEESPRADDHSNTPEHFVAGELLGPLAQSRDSDPDVQAAESIDVVASDEDIKKVFQLSLDPVGTTCSLVVQRVGNALVLDGSFDGNGKTTSQGKSDARDSLTSKFLFYSVKMAASAGSTGDHGDGHGEDVDDKSAHVDVATGVRGDDRKTKKRTRAAVAVARETSRPLQVETAGEVSQVTAKENEGAKEPSTSASAVNADANIAEEDAGSTNGGSCDVPFARVVRWRVGDFNLLLGSNLVIARDQEDSCAVSLQLHDAADQLTSQVCLDYWLDNKINGAQRTAICIHREGLVKGYKLVNTNELPHLDLENAFPLSAPAGDADATLGSERSSFAPTAVTSGACSILSFLKDNCKEDGATYYLFKRPGASAEVCLFELMSSRQGPETSAGLRRQFAVPVATLYRRLATRLLADAAPSSRERAVRLLTQSIETLTSGPKVDASCLAGTIASRRLLAKALLPARAFAIRAPLSVQLSPPADNDKAPLEAIDLAEAPNDALVVAAETLRATLHEVHLLAAAARRHRGVASQEDDAYDGSRGNPFQVEGETLESVELQIRESLMAIWLRLALANVQQPSIALAHLLFASRIADPATLERHLDIILFWAAFLLARATAQAQIKAKAKAAGHDEALEEVEQPKASPADLSDDDLYPLGQPLAAVPPVLQLVAKGTVDVEFALNQVTQLLWRSVSKRPRRECGRDLLFESYLSLAKYYALHGRFTKAFRHLLQGVQLFKSLQSTKHVETLQLELLYLSFQSFCGIDLRERQDVASAETLVSVLSDAEAHARAKERLEKFGVQNNRQALCSHELEAYRRAWSAAQSLLESGTDGTLALGVEAKESCALAAARYGVELCSQKKHDEGKKRLLQAIELAQGQELLAARCRLAYALGTAQRLNTGVAGTPKAMKFDTGLERVFKAMVSELQSALHAFETMAADQNRAALVDALVTRTELARLHLFAFESNESSMWLLRGAFAALFAAGPLIAAVGGANKTADATQEDLEEDAHYWTVLQKLLQRACQQGLRARRDDGNLKQAYRRSLEGDGPETMLPAVEALVNASK